MRRAILVSVLLLIISADCGYFQEKTGRTAGMKIVLVVDVSPSMRIRENDIIQFVSLVYDSLKRFNKDDIHLITFSNDADLFDTINEKEIGIAKIKERINQSTTETIPRRGLNEVFNLIETEFPKKVGVVLFLSDGENSRRKQTTQLLKSTVASLKTSGFNIISVFVKTDPIYSCEACMQEISTWARTTFHSLEALEKVQYEFNKIKFEVEKMPFSSPIIFSEHKKIINNLIYIIIASVVIIITMLLIWRFLLYKPNNIDPFPFIWGNLETTDNNKRNLIELKINEWIKTPDDYPNFQLRPVCKKKGKAIEIMMESEFESKVKCDYIDDESAAIEIEAKESDDKSESDLKPIIYNYWFLKKLEDNLSPIDPDVDDFVGRMDDIQEIKNNFLGKSEKHNICSMNIYGMGNIGKTSLIKFIIENHFKNDREISSKYDSIYINYTKFCEFKSKNKKIFKNIDQFNDQINIFVNYTFENPTKDVILVIDEYDFFFAKYKNKFGEWLVELRRSFKYIFIFVGQKSITLLSPEYSKYLRNLIFRFVKVSDLGMSDSITLIDKTLKNLGLSTDFLSREQKRYISDQASFIPYFIKKIILSMLKAWLRDYNMHPVKNRDIEEVILKIRDDEKVKGFTIERWCKFDEEMYPDRRTPLIKDIINAISSLGNGEASKEEIFKKVIPNCHLSNQKDQELFDNKITNLIEMGALDEDNGSLIGIPRLLYNTGGKIV